MHIIICGVHSSFRHYLHFVTNFCIYLEHSYTDKSKKSLPRIAKVLSRGCQIWQLARIYDFMESFENFYQECSNDDLRLTLCFMARLNLLPELLFENTSWILQKILDTQVNIFYALNVKIIL